MRPKTIALAVAAALSGIPAVQAGTILFDEAPVPLTDQEKRQIIASDRAVVDGQPVAIGYHTILRSGDLRGRRPDIGVFGQLFDINGQKLMAEDGSDVISSDNDFSSLLIGDNGRLYMVSHFEARPGAMYLTEMRQNRQNGSLYARRTRPLDFSGLKGGWVHCAGSVTPYRVRFQLPQRQFGGFGGR
jgi:hypothetical protein